MQKKFFHYLHFNTFTARMEHGQYLFKKIKAARIGLLLPICCLLALWPINVSAEALANSGYPTAGANAERNYLINRPVSYR